MTKDPPMVLNMSDVDAKRRLISKIGTLQGLYEVAIRPRKRTRSLNANAYYWSAVVGPWTEWLRAEWGDPTISPEQAHIELKKAVLGMREHVRPDGEVMELVPTTHDMEKEEFGQYIEGASKFLAEFAAIVVLSSELFYDTKSQRKNSNDNRREDPRRRNNPTGLHQKEAGSAHSAAAN